MRSPVKWSVSCRCGGGFYQEPPNVAPPLVMSTELRAGGYGIITDCTAVGALAPQAFTDCTLKL